MKDLPYANSTADPTRAQKRIRETLQKFGVQRIGFDDDFENLELMIRFIYKDFPVSLPVNYGELAELYLEAKPHTYRMRLTETEYITKKRETAYRAAYSMLEDYLKSMVTLIELGAFSFEEIFLSYFTDNRGMRLGQHMAPRLKEFAEGRLALPEGD